MASSKTKKPLPPIGTCKISKQNPRTKLCARLCVVGKDQSRNGWKITGSVPCPPPSPT